MGRTFPKKKGSGEGEPPRNAARKARQQAKAAKTTRGRKMLRKRGIVPVDPAAEHDDMQFFEDVDFAAIEREMRQDMPSGLEAPAAGGGDLELEETQKGDEEDSGSEEEDIEDIAQPVAVPKQQARPQPNRQRQRPQLKRIKKDKHSVQYELGASVLSVCKLDAVKTPVTAEAASFRDRLLNRHKRVPTAQLQHRQATFERFRR